MNTFFKRNNKMRIINQRLYRNKYDKVVTSVEREKIGDSNGAIRLGKKLQEGVQKRRDKNPLQN